MNITRRQWLAASAAALAPAALPAFAQDAVKEPAYREFPWTGSRLAVWAVAQLHLNFAAFILGGLLPHPQHARQPPLRDDRRVARGHTASKAIVREQVRSERRTPPLNRGRPARARTCSYESGGGGASRCRP